ncbi:Translation initiation factor IF-2 [Phlyctema vagabunda]|uniref:Translation initiation factor IF-2 n=1 Tax=Phlyctema vagabunda TaxID=108571 RepID=A0ABR4PP38_9HELO
MPSFSLSTALLTLALLVVLARPAHAFGAGNIASVAKIEGSNWRHGDIEDTLLTLVMSRAAGGKKFNKLNVARVYFGNWLRDYSQAIDVGTVKYVSAEAIRILLWVLGFMTFGYGTKEFEVTADRLGCYRPEDHIDNPKDYADNEDATQYDRRLRAPVDESVELAIDPNTGMKNYIANEDAGIMTSAKHVRNLFRKSVELGRAYAQNNRSEDLHEALRLLGTGLHCLEDFSAHSNYTELALIEMGERDVFPHVGSNTEIRLDGARGSVFPLVTGTFGGVDFLHSVCGEVGDKAKQSEIQALEGTLQENSQSDNSALKDLLDKIPDGIFGGKDEAGKADELKENATQAQMAQVTVSPREPEEFTKQMQEVQKQIFPIIEWHDETMQAISEAIEKIPILPEIIEQFEEQLNIYVFSLLAPFVVPIISQIKNELNTGSSEIIASSKDKQLIVFNDDESSDPTHSMLSKDHFSNILNEPAGKIASQVLKWVVPQLIKCWDNENEDVDRTIDRIIHGVFHHPAQREQGEDGASEGRRLMFSVVENWWNEQRNQDELRGKLTRDGVMNGENHKEGVEDSGHGCCKPLKMAKSSGSPSNTAAGALMGNIGAALDQSTGGNSGGYGGSSGGGQGSNQFESKVSEAVGGGALGGILGAVGGSLLSGFGKSSKDDDDNSGGYQQSQSSYGGNQQSENQYGGGRRTEEQSYGQSGNQGYGQSENQYGGGRRTEEQSYGQSESGYGGGRRNEEQSYGQSGNQGYGQSESGYGGGRRNEEQSYGQSESGYGGGRRNEEQSYGQSESGYGGGRRNEEQSYGQSESGYGGGREERRNERQEEGGYGGRQGGGYGEDNERRGGGYGGEERRDGGYGEDNERRGGGYGGDNDRREGYGEEREEYGQRRRSRSREGRREEGGGW